MATISATDMTGSGARNVAETTLDGLSDTFTYNARKSPVLVLRNPTAGAISPIIDGDGASVVPVQGVGSVDISGGYAVGAIAAGDAKAVPLVSISQYLAGTIDIAGATGLVASLLEF